MAKSKIVKEICKVRKFFKKGTSNEEGLTSRYGVATVDSSSVVSNSVIVFQESTCSSENLAVF